MVVYKLICKDLATIFCEHIGMTLCLVVRVCMCVVCMCVVCMCGVCVPIAPFCWVI